MEVEIVIRGEAETGRVRFRSIHTKDGRNFASAYNPANVQKWQAHTRLVAQESMGDHAPLEGPLRADFLIVVPVPKSFSNKKQHLAMRELLFPVTRPDCSNYLKTAEDALLGIVYRDDSQIVMLSVRKVYGAVPRMVIRVKTLDDLAVMAERNLFEEQKR